MWSARARSRACCHVTRLRAQIVTTVPITLVAAATAVARETGSTKYLLLHHPHLSLGFDWYVAENHQDRGAAAEIFRSVLDSRRRSGTPRRNLE